MRAADVTAYLRINAREVVKEGDAKRPTRQKRQTPARGRRQKSQTVAYLCALPHACELAGKAPARQAILSVRADLRTYETHKR